jgi:hypothetical protein
MKFKIRYVGAVNNWLSPSQSRCLVKLRSVRDVNLFTYVVRVLLYTGLIQRFCQLCVIPSQRTMYLTQSVDVFLFDATRLKLELPVSIIFRIIDTRW